MCLRVCALAHTVHTHHATLQATNLCHLHQNNYGGINTTFDHFHSDLSCEGAQGEMIKSPPNGTDRCCVYNIQPTAALKMYVLVLVCVWLGMFGNWDEI